ncbi:NAD(P)-bd-dom domain-containing protein [Mycena indigotica]|uniref:NAD(P)-bd-dom domain-containing protein n=1 Tax=Mycena indigotica TaxID=2126181 RepID=A0A8H6TGD9_9AGAR|nr:NAD(P)-bd-dom domain-containing protein [Mycena indigotica]KAF7316196.1 NAD(P)-bd-dom domain-containing protein [Mycena indigotica]
MSPIFAKDQATGFSNRIEKVAIVGAGGTIGSYFTKYLLATGKHQITALARENSKAHIPDVVHRIIIDYDDEYSLVEALKGQDLLVITLGVSAREEGGAVDTKLINAAAKAGVPYIMPNAYGPDPLNEGFVRTALTAPAALIEKLGVSKWIALSTGFWYELSLASGSFGIDVEEHTAKILDDGNTKITVSTWDQCGRAFAALLSLQRLREDENDKAPVLEDWANKVVYFSSFRVSQNDIFESAKRVTGTSESDWRIESIPSAVQYNDALEAVKKGDRSAFTRLLYARVLFPTGEGDHTRHGLANEALGLTEEDLDEATKAALRYGKAAAQSYGR